MPIIATRFSDARCIGYDAGMKAAKKSTIDRTPTSLPKRWDVFSDDRERRDYNNGYLHAITDNLAEAGEMK